MKTRIAILTGCRSDYGLLRPLIRRVDEEPGTEITLYAVAGHLSPFRGMTVDQIIRDGFKPVTLAPVDDADDTPTGMALLASTVSGELGRLWREKRPDWLVVLGDRVEVLGAAVAAWYSRIPLAQLQAGDLSLIDDGPRHAVSRLAHLLFPATASAAERLIRWGEEAWRVQMTGSLAIDHALTCAPLTPSELTDLGERLGLTLTGDFLVLVYHPLPGEPERTAKGLTACLKAVDAISLPTLVIHPNADAGGRQVADRMKRWVAKKPIHAFQSNLSPGTFIGILQRTRALIGNSSAGLIECSALGTPVVNVGPRQGNRERGANVFDTGPEVEEIKKVLEEILAEGDLREKLRRQTSPYGDGTTAKRVLQRLLETPVDVRLLDKTLTG